MDTTKAHLYVLCGKGLVYWQTLTTPAGEFRLPYVEIIEGTWPNERRRWFNRLLGNVFAEDLKSHLGNLEAILKE